MHWNLNDLRNSIEHRFGAEQRRAVSASASSLILRLQHCEYHIQKFEDIERRMVEGWSSQGLFIRIFESTVSEIGELHFEAGVHCLGAAQALHAASDIAGCAIALAMRPGLEWRGYLKDIFSALGPLAVTFAPLIKRLQCHTDYKYLEDLVNQSKHRNVVALSMRTNFSVDGESHFEFISFDRTGKKYPVRPAKAFLISEFNRQALIFFNMGLELSRIATDMRSTPV